MAAITAVEALNRLEVIDQAEANYHDATAQLIADILARVEEHQEMPNRHELAKILATAAQKQDIGIEALKEAFRSVEMQSAAEIT